MGKKNKEIKIFFIDYTQYKKRKYVQRTTAETSNILIDWRSMCDAIHMKMPFIYFILFLI